MINAVTLQSWYRDGSVQCFNNYKHLLLFLFGLVVMLFTSALIIYIWLLTVGGLDIMTNVCMYNKTTLCVKFTNTIEICNPETSI